MTTEKHPKDLPPVDLENPLLINPLPLRFWRALFSCCVSTEWQRPTLASVQIESNDAGLCMVATNGHKLLELRTTHEYPNGKWWVPTEEVKRLTKIPLAMDGHWSTCAQYRSAGSPGFPDYISVINRETVPVTRIVFSSLMVGTAAQVSNRLGWKTSTKWQFQFCGEVGPVNCTASGLVKGADETTARLVLMPALMDRP